MEDQVTITDTITDATPELSHTLAFPYDDAFAGIASVLPHASKDGMTPIICAVHVSAEAFIATDRYAIGMYTHGAPIHPDTDAVVLPRTAAEWLGKQTPKALGLDRHTATTALLVTITADSVTITRDGDTLAFHRFEAPYGQFPPVARLLNGWKPATDAQPTALKPEFVTRFSVSASKLIDKSEAYTLELGHTDSGKPGPVRFTIGDKFTGLLQPNLIR